MTAFRTQFHTPPLIKKMIWVFLVCFGLQTVFQGLLPNPKLDSLDHLALMIHHNPFLDIFGLVPHNVFAKGYVWQLITYMFFHGNLTHLLFNLLAFWMFGSELVMKWEGKQFMKFFLVCGLGAGIFHLATTYLFFYDSVTRFIPTVGASGAIYGILMAYALLFGNRMILFFFVFPMKARTAVLIIGAIEIYYSITATSDGIAHLAHLGGMAVGYLYLRFSHLHYSFQMWKYQKSRDKLRKRLKVIVDNTQKRRDGSPGDDPNSSTFH
jgi:membrane associated rhomboid family serine protease